MDSNRYARQTVLPEIGIEGQCRLSAASVLIVGLGGLGCPVASYLTGAGVGRIGLCDHDVVSLSNLQRQTLYRESDVGISKAEVARSVLSSMSSATQFVVHAHGLTDSEAGELIGGYDIVVDCCDNHHTRYLIDDVCSVLGKTWIHGSIGAFTGMVTVFEPGHTRYSDIFPDREALESLGPSSGGVVGAVPGVVGAIQAAEAVKTICGFGTRLVDRILTIDIKTQTYNTIEL